MNKISITQLLLCIFLVKVKCESNSKENSKNKKIIPYFRRQVEEIEDKNLSETFDVDDPHSNIVSFIVNNVKEIFVDDDNDVLEKPETTKPDITEPELPQPELLQINNPATVNEIATTPVKPTFTYISSPEIFRQTVNITETLLIFPTHTDVMLYENLTVTTTLIADTQAYTELYEINTKNSTKIKSLIEGTEYPSKQDKKEREFNLLGRSLPGDSNFANSSEIEVEQDPRRSCIMCNNVWSEDCNDPKNKLIQSVLCEREDDMCYSMHTPFGIIDRGCFNSNHNLTTYACSCNLCNYISISEMPYMFSNKRDWVDNVIEISRTRHFRNSIFKDMSCLKCEVNTTQQQGDVLDSANCLEGHIGNIPVTQCGQNEICGVKALRADGYIWRGCMKVPLYNYWWSLCDFDLCNFDSVISLYDFV